MLKQHDLDDNVPHALQHKGISGITRAGNDNQTNH